MKKLLVVLLATMMMVACKKEIIIPDPTVSISANPMTVDYKGTTTVSWTSTNATSCSLNGSSVATTGSVSVVMTETKTFSITAYGENGKTANGMVNVTVTLPPAPQITVTGTPTQPLKYFEDSATINYTVTGYVDSTTLNNVKVPNSGTFTTSKLVHDTTFTLKAFGPGGTTTRVITIPVVLPPTRTDSLCLNKYWQRTETMFCVNGDTTYTALDAEQLRIQSHYFPNGDLKSFDPFDGSSNMYKWMWIGTDSLEMAGNRYQYKLSNTTLVLSERNGTIVDIYKSFTK